jgi:Exo70 exocyst complex subunit
MFGLPSSLLSMHSEMEIGRWERVFKWARVLRRTKQIIRTSLNILFVSHFHFRLYHLAKRLVDDVVITAINSLVTLSRSRRPAFGSIFLLNNISYLRLHLLLKPSNPNLRNLIPQSTEEVLNSNFRTAKAGYFDSNFSPLMQAISEDPRDKSNRSAGKEKFTRFFDLLDEVIERHKLVAVLEDDVAGRDAMRDEVVMVVIPSFQKFTRKQKDKEFSKSMLLLFRPAFSFVSKSYLVFSFTPRSSEM